MTTRTDIYAELEIGLHRAPDDAYEVELRFTDPESDGEVAPVKGLAPISLPELLVLELEPRAYGEKLAARLFESEEIRGLYGQVKAAVEKADLFLRLRLLVGPTAPELHALRWELLCDPDTKTPLATSERTLFSRFMVSRGWRQVRPRPRAELGALIAVAAPADVKTAYGLAEVQRASEIEGARRGLAAIEPAVLEEPVTLERLVNGLRQGVDVLYLVCHGGFRRGRSEPDQAIVYLEGEDGLTAPTAGAELAERVAELERPPRLVVLASCESGATGDADGAQAALAPLLAAAGVPAIVAMQGQVSMDTVKDAMPVFFTELLQDGQIDRALAVARGAVRDQSDSWMPALYLRLKGGRLWNDAGFRGRDRVKWRNLCRQVRDGRFVPILGPGVTERLGRGEALARRLADAHRFPLSEDQKADLPRVLQFIAAKEKRTAVVPELEEQWQQLVREIHGPNLPDDLAARLGGMELPELLDAVGEHCRQDPDEPHRILAGLPAEIYVTTNVDDLLGRALEDGGKKEPQRLVCRWRDEPPIAPALEDEVSAARPAVYHLLGSLDDEESLVLTEDDYFDYLIATAANQLIPDDVASVLGDRSLLFVGFQLTDWSFRVLFRLILSFEGRRLKDYPHVAVQVDPATADFPDAEGARDYLRQYFGAAADIDVYWGSAEDFLVQLRDKLGGRGDG